MEERRTLEERVCRVPGVRDVVNKTEIAQTL
jgi:osmotically-inducible protein OsmY